MRKKGILYDIINGIAGGAFIAVGSVSAIDYMERGPSSVLLFVVIGIMGCIAAEYFLRSRGAVCALSAGMFLVGMLLGIPLIRYLASGFVIYTGCALSLPEKDIFTDAVTAASAAVGFMMALTAIL